MAGKERHLKIAAGTLCSRRSFPEHRNPKIEQTFPFLLLFQGKGSGESSVSCSMVLFAWEEEAGAVRGDLPSSAS